MNKQAQVRTTAIRAYEPVDFAAWSYVATPDTFDGCYIRTNPHNGAQIATGRNKLGLVVTLTLDVPLCVGCDNPIDHGVCHDCELVFTNEPILGLTAQSLRDPMGRRG